MKPVWTLAINILTFYIRWASSYIFEITLVFGFLVYIMAYLFNSSLFIFPSISFGSNETILPVLR